MLRLAAGILLAILALAARPSATIAQTSLSTAPDTLVARHALGAADLARLVTPPAGAPDHERLAPSVAAVPADGAIDLDGHLDEPVWRTAPVVDRFLQREHRMGRQSGEEGAGTLTAEQALGEAAHWAGRVPAEPRQCQRMTG